MFLGEVLVHMFSMLLVALRLRPSSNVAAFVPFSRIAKTVGRWDIVGIVEGSMRKLEHEYSTSSGMEDCRKMLVGHVSLSKCWMIASCPGALCYTSERGGAISKFALCLFEVQIAVQSRGSCLDQLVRVVSCSCLPIFGIGCCGKQGYDLGTSGRKNMIGRRPRL